MSLWVIPTIHPASLVRGQWHKEPAQQATFRRVAKALAGGGPEVWDVNEPPEGSILYPTLRDLQEFYEDTKSGGWDALAHDIEAAGPHLICDGMTQVKLGDGSVGRSLCLRFRRQGGGLYWEDWEDHRAAVGWLWWVLADPGVAKVMHNGVTYDVPVLEELGFTVAGRLVDTMILAHTAYSEFPKGLQFCATLWNGAPVWKRLVEDEEGEGKG